MSGYITEIGGKKIKIDLPSEDGIALIDGLAARYSHSWIDDTEGTLHLIVDERSYDLRIEDGDGQLILTRAGRRYHCSVVDEHIADLKQRSGLSDHPAGPTIVKSPMPGLVVRVLVEPGTLVQKGDRILILEAMKMENDVKSPRSGRVSSILVAPGEAVAGGSELAVIE